ncbi:ABC transporter ATP-binding protein [Thalassospira sp. HF15]|uniref:energy-coupling factor ABC transporter ATP-binding protein n=1 Tax=Thalassospira sp. HF15 TaxID=2722755 RepID=UPI00143212DA|nr:ABC transporter ATP-binding protein [Thalassospira sp. HF15]NIY74443.1 ABC transporter ATP-binding protein [Thalassospira sp. HF15]
MSSLIELNDISYGYRAGQNVLNNVSLTLDPGERLFLAGPNGAGKSTLLRIVVGLIKPHAGEIRAFGTPRFTDTEFHDLRCRVGFIVQDPDDQLFCPTVIEDIAFGPLNLGASREEALAIVDEVLEQLHLTHLRERITHELSGGEKRLVSVAAVLAMKPDVLLLDEPTNALDEENMHRLEEILLGLPQAMILVSHDPHFRRKLATRIIELRTGKVLQLPKKKCTAGERAKQAEDAS